MQAQLKWILCMILCVMVGLSISQGALADELLFVVHDDGHLDGYDVNANTLSNAPVSLNNGVSIFNVAPSPGGRRLYAMDAYGGLHMIDPTDRSTRDFGTSVGAGGYGLAVSYDRAELFATTGTQVAVCDTGTVSIQRTLANGNYFDIAANPNDTLLYAADLGVLDEFNTVTGTPSNVAATSWPIQEIAVSRDGNYVVFTTQQDETGDGLVVTTCEGMTACGSVTIEDVGDSAGISFTYYNNRKFFLGTTKGGVFAIMADTNSPTALPKFGSVDIRDVVVGPSDQIYVLYDHKLERWSDYGSTPQPILKTFHDGAARWQLLVVPERPGSFKSRGLLGLRPELFALLEETVLQKKPWPWGDEHQLDCTDCDEALVRSSAKLASEFLESIETEGPSVEDVITFLQKTADLDRFDASWWLDHEIIGPIQK